MRLCDCHGVPMDYRADRDRYECSEKRRARQRAYFLRRFDTDFIFRTEHCLRSRRRTGLKRRAARARRKSAGEI